MKFFKNSILALVVGIAIISMVACGGNGNITSAKVGKSNVDSASYSLGVLIGGRFLPKEFYEELNLELLAKGIHDVRDSSEQWSAEEANQIIQAYSQAIQEAKGAKNLEESQAFLEANKSKEGVQVTPSGLQYKVISEGTGAKPAPTDKVKVNYRGTFIDGKEFDSGVGVEFGVGQVIRGWQEGLQMMSVGSKYEFYIPSDLAYGPQGGQGMEPNKALVFTVDLLDISAPDENAPDPRLGN